MDISWDEVQREALKVLIEYIRIDTTNPPGNEKAAADFLRRILNAEGLDVHEYAKDSARPNILCRLRGDGTKRPLILLNHMDVVMAERDQWRVDPFAGAVKDGFVWGRGALDMKGLGIIELMAFLLVHRSTLPLSRDLIYLAVSDEETGGAMGGEWLINHLESELDAEYLINEGGAGWRIGDMTGFNLAVGEKGPLWLLLRTEGPPGHGSVPVAENAVVRLARALSAIAEYRQPIRVIGQMRGFLEKAGIDPDIDPNELATQGLLAIPHISAMFSNTISPTVLRAGEKENVIPSKAEAVLDCRLLPGVTVEDFIHDLKRVIGDEEVHVEIIKTYESSVSAVDTEMYRLLEDILEEVYPGVPVLPTISTGFTDSRWFRARGTTCYGILPFISDFEVLRTMHGHDERIDIQSLGQGSRVIFEMIKRLNT